MKNDDNSNFEFIYSKDFHLFSGNTSLQRNYRGDEGFIEPFIRELPFEYAVELDRLVKLEMEHPRFNYPKLT